MQRILSILLIGICLFLYILSDQCHAANDPWIEELKGAVGLSVGDLDHPRFPDFEKEKTGVDGDIQGGGREDFLTDPDTMDPNKPDVSRIIREWISIAEPPQNATERARFRYDQWGRIVGQTADGANIRPTGQPDYALASPEATVWSIRNKLDSVNHCTLEEYTIAKLDKRSIDHCIGRYQAPASVKVAVGTLTGLPLSDAKEALIKVGLKPRLTAGGAAPTKKDESTIASQKPSPGTALKRGQTVTLVIYGPYSNKVLIPDLRGMSLKSAKARLADNGLKADAAAAGSAPSSDLSFKVKGTKPSAGTSVSGGTRVKVEIYSEYKKPQVKIPAALGRAATTVKSELESLGLKPVLQAEGSAPTPYLSYTIKEIIPKAGTRVSQGSAVTLNVYGKYSPPLVAVPNVAELGLNYEDAKRKIQAAGLSLEKHDGGRPSKKNQSDIAMRQNPLPGVKVKKGDTVRVWFYGKYIPTKAEQVAQADCSKYPGTRAYWDDKTGRPRCGCVDGYVWSKKQNRCIKKLSPDEKCAQAYPGSIANGKKPNGKINCECPNGYVWNSDNGKPRCVKKSAARPPQKKSRCPAAISHIKTLVALTNDNNREISKRLIEDAVQEARQAGCSETQISAARGKSGGSGGGGSGSSDEDCPCVDENGRRYRVGLGQDCDMDGVTFRDYCD